jgi:hypothetical protein
LCREWTPVRDVADTATQTGQAAGHAKYRPSKLPVFSQDLRSIARPKESSLFRENLWCRFGDALMRRSQECRPRAGRCRAKSHSLNWDQPPEPTAICIVVVAPASRRRPEGGLRVSKSGGRVGNFESDHKPGID